MQMIVLGMHRSGTSAVARLLNMMGAYFAPENMELPATTDNPKGYWERRDVVNLHEEILTHLRIKWDNIHQFELDKLTPEIHELFGARIKEIVLKMDANRPWLLKDPRLCLLMPLWQPYCELPLYIYVYRHPVQIAQSLAKRDNLSLSYALALWEKYTLLSLQATTNAPKLIVSYHDLIENPIITTHKLYAQLLEQQIQGLRLPTDKEILAFLDPNLFRQRGTDELQNQYINQQQLALVQQFSSGEIFNLASLPYLSQGAHELLAAHDTHQSLLTHFNALHEENEIHKSRLSDYHAIVLNRDSEIEKRDTLIQQKDAEIVSLIEQLKNHAELAQAKTELIATQNNLLKQKYAYEEKTRKLEHTVQALYADIQATFNSISWKLGSYATRLILMLTFKQQTRTAQHHIEEIMRDFSQYSRIPINTTVEKNNAPSYLTKVGARDYTAWVQNYDTFDEKQRQKMQSIIETWQKKPLISIIMPTYNTEARWLKAAIESVLTQVYPHWELCIADDASKKPHVKQILEEYANKDKRIKVVFREQNGHISAASNSALELATGEYIAFLDHDDELMPNALFWMVEDILNYPQCKLWYSDEDKIDENNKRFDPYFKSDWNPDLFLSHNLITHLAVYEATLLKQLGGLREGFEGAQDYDLALRFTEQVHPSEIRHIPRILYHWRAISGSTATAPDEKPYALLAAIKAIGEFLQRKKIKAEVMENPEIRGTLRVRYELPYVKPLVSLIIPTRNGFKLLKQCIESIWEKTDYRSFEILIVNNQSDDKETLDYMQQLEQLNKARIIDYPYEFNYADMNNCAAQHAKGELIGLLNNDIEVINEDWLSEMVSHALRPEVGIVGARLWYPDNTLQHGGVVIGIAGAAGHAHKAFPKGHVGYMGRAALIQNFSAVTAACLVMRKAVFTQAGGLDAEHLKVAMNDVDLSLKMNELGLRVVWTPYAELYHHESATRGYEDTPEKAARYEQEKDYMRQRWAAHWAADPMYSPNLTIEAQDFSLAFPPRVSIL